MLNKSKHSLPFLPSWFVLGVFLLISFPIYSKEEGVKLEWRPIPDAGGYMVEIKDSRGKITREKTNTTLIQLELPPGTYEHRIGVLNRYGRVSVFSAWIPFEVILSQKPEILSAEKNKFLNKDLPDTFEIKGRHFTDATKVILKDSKGSEVSIKSMEVKNSETILVTLDKKRPPEGAVSVRVENPRNKVTEKENYLFVAETESDLAALEAKGQQKESVSSGAPFRFDYGAVARSAIIPGWGQYYQNKSNFRTFLFPALLLGAGAYVASEGNSYLSASHALAAARQNNVLYNYAFIHTGNPALFDLAFYNYTQIAPKYSAAVAEYSQLEVGIGVLGFFYLLNLMDAGFFAGNKEVKVEGAPGPVTVSPVIRNLKDQGQINSYSLGNSPNLFQRMEVGVQFAW
ncbi:hypothetical protein EHQ53_02005 [Leptospira langatensis]|uniref:DUF5683 domain-containing protein n=1 Tax=Leptospira langatensis TaxID=2484983 RepID=A0A5F1ZZE8_9LEPT|nr:hypothetical protein [Leptospira langatensis]TGJ98518.1 hypothetical protein EHO57_18145 [Leptospira langatensis]TGL43433.1 hypothetical protein EHQ53_02005 [Leptospira langatensis]